MDSAKNWKATKARFDERNRLKAKGRRGGRVFCGTPVGQRATVDLFLKPFIEFMEGERPQIPLPPPDDLGEAFYSLNRETRALIALAPVLDAAIGGWDGSDGSSPVAALKLKIGIYLHDRLAYEKLLTSDDEADGRLAKKIDAGDNYALKYLKYDWTQEQYLRAGHWLLECALEMPYFVIGDEGLEIAPKWQADVEQIIQGMMRRDSVLLPHTTPPFDWTGPIAKYDARLQKPFVRDWRPETQAEIGEAFRSKSIEEHVNGVNTLQRVALRIDQTMVGLVKEFAVKVKKHKDHRGAQLKRDKGIVLKDVATAAELGDSPFYLTYNCDRRGRIYAIPHFNYGREDHVRSLFKFHEGLPLDTSGMEWLEIHCANCQGDTAKMPLAVRRVWARMNRRLIREIRTNPFKTFDKWMDADKPFQFVAACLELVAAWANPGNFVRRLPISFDGTCNGIQHLSMIGLDRVSGTMVNLTDDIERHMHDVYSIISDRVQNKLKDDGNKWAKWWVKQFERLDDKKKRKLFKTPAGTFSYAATNRGRLEQITEIYRNLFDGLEPKDPAGLYLAQKIKEVAEETLPGPTRVMRYIQKLTKHCSDKDRYLRWTSPTGFPVCNRYNEPNMQTINLVGPDGARVRHDIGEGVLPKIKKHKARSSAAANFVHSQDASHLIKVVNTAEKRGITNVLTIHDCFACLAPEARRFRIILKGQLADMYEDEPLVELRRLNAGNAEFEDPPARGDLDRQEVILAEHPFS
jgi:DNA-directed RNA polymerase